MTEDFPSAHDLSKTDMIKNLSKLAAIIDNKERKWTLETNLHI